MRSHRNQYTLLINLQGCALEKREGPQRKGRVERGMGKGLGLIFVQVSTLKPCPSRHKNWFLDAIKSNQASFAILLVGMAWQNGQCRRMDRGETDGEAEADWGLTMRSSAVPGVRFIPCPKERLPPVLDVSPPSALGGVSSICWRRGAS